MIRFERLKGNARANFGEEALVDDFSKCRDGKIPYEVRKGEGVNDSQYLIVTSVRVIDTRAKEINVVAT